MAGQQIPAAPDPKGAGKPRAGATPAPAPAPATAPVAASLSGVTPDQAKEFHAQFKVTYTAFVGLAALAHLFVIAKSPWF